MATFPTGAEYTVEQRLTRLESYLQNLAMHRDSRRGPEGVRGEIGATGATGAPGKDADIAEAIKVVRKEMYQDHENLEELHTYLTPGVLGQLVDHRLKVAGVIDENGKAILIPGRDGKDGLDSTVQGPKGDSVTGKDGIDGRSITGPAGRDAKIFIGSVIAGSEASITLRETSDGQVLDFVVPRGETGAPGANSTIAGPQGPPGVSLSRSDVAAIVLDMAKRGSLPNLAHDPLQSQQPVTQPIDLEAHAEAIAAKILEKQRAPKRGIVASLLSRLFFGS